MKPLIFSQLKTLSYFFLPLRFRGREMAHMQSSKHILTEFGENLSDVAVVEKEPKVEGRSMTMFLAEKR